MIWKCPRCRADLAEQQDALLCGGCQSHYPVVAGIADLRLPGASWIDYQADTDAARKLAEETEGLSVEQVVRHVFASRPEWNEKQVDYRTRQVLEAPERLKREINGWLRPCMPDHGTFLDLGCGPGMLLAAAAAGGWNGVGIDVSMAWLVVAKRLIVEWGGKPVLAAALAESLPLADNSVDSVMALDVIEHVADPTPFLREIDRVTAPGGRVALATPNRFSLAAEPHVSVWGVGWLPRRLQKRYVKWRSGKSYDYVQLLSTRETRRLMRDHTRLDPQLLTPPVAEEEIERFPPYRAVLARTYNRLLQLPLMRGVFLGVGPFFRVVATKRAADETGTNTQLSPAASGS